MAILKKTEADTYVLNLFREHEISQSHFINDELNTATGNIPPIWQQ